MTRSGKIYLEGARAVHFDFHQFLDSSKAHTSRKSLQKSVVFTAVYKNYRTFSVSTWAPPCDLG